MAGLVVAPCIAARQPDACAFTCGCTHPECNCEIHCVRHANAISAHRDDPTHELHGLALIAYHPED